MIAPRLRFPLTAFALALGTCLALFAGCGLSTGGIPSADGGTPCTDDGQCDDGDPCTTDKCGVEGTCGHNAVPDGPAPASSQVPGDCHKILCMGGMRSSVVDDTDKPDSHNPCVKDECSAGMPLQDKTANDNASCTLANNQPGTCSDGMCTVQCGPTMPCPDMGACKIPRCDGATSHCFWDDVKDGTPTPGVATVAGDCHVHICIGGMDTDQPDDSDVPDVPAALAGCADAKCTSGMPSNPLHAADSVCSTYMGSMPGHCDAMGHCVECVKDTDCPGTTDDCQHPACVNALCSVAHTPAGTPTTTTPPQIPGDCHKIVCDGNGGSGPVVDDTDPPNSGTVCITDTCSNGSVKQTFNQGVVCGMSMGMQEKCNAAGQCGCQNNSDCTLPNTCGGGGVALVCGCTPKTCANLGKTCGGPFPDQCFGNLACNDSAKNGTETDVDCGGNVNGCATRCANGKKCTTGSDCTSGFCVDNVCCSTACTGTCQACSAAAKGQGVDGVCGAVKLGGDPHNECPMQNVSTCGRSGGCNGSGACSTYASGTVCVNASCMSGTVLTKADTCANGTCTAPSPATQDCSPYQCMSAACTTTCQNDGNCASGSYCDAAHHCQPKLANGSGTCSGNNQCLSNICGTNGTCCSGMCTASPPCGLTGGCAANTGACLNAASGTTCSKTVGCNNGVLTTDTQCDGSGACSSGMMMNNCPGNTVVCKDAMTCFPGCGMTGAAGDARCDSTHYCNGVGAGSCVAQLANGAACGGDDQCTSGVCGTTGTGNCCTTACMNVGMTCGGTACTSGGACTYPGGSTSCGASVCSNGMISTKTCDGSGGCQTNAAALCPGNRACQSGSACQTGGGCGGNDTAGDNNCADGYWCDGMSGGACQAAQPTGSMCTRASQCSSSMGCNTGTMQCK